MVAQAGNLPAYGFMEGGMGMGNHRFLMLRILFSSRLSSVVPCSSGIFMKNRYFFSAWIFCIAAIVYNSLLTAPGPPVFALQDKALHAAAYTERYIY